MRASAADEIRAYCQAEIDRLDDMERSLVEQLSTISERRQYCQAAIDELARLL